MLQNLIKSSAKLQHTSQGEYNEAELIETVFNLPLVKTQSYCISDTVLSNDNDFDYNNEVYLNGYNIDNGTSTAQQMPSYSKSSSYLNSGRSAKCQVAEGNGAYCQKSK
ncbi:unnamed protein product [Gordionus sp. m RMFG-2023]